MILSPGWQRQCDEAPAAFPLRPFGPLQMDPHMFHPKGPACCTQASGQKTSAEAKSERSAKSARCSQLLIAPGWVSQTSTSAIFTGLDAFKFDSKASISVSRCRWLGDSMLHPQGRGRLHPWDANVARNMQRLQRLLTANWSKSVEIEIEYTQKHSGKSTWQEWPSGLATQ